MTEQINPSTTPLQALPPKQATLSIRYGIALIFLVVGMLSGVGIMTLFPGREPLNPPSTISTSAPELTLPPDAVRIQECSDHRGTLYIEPKNIPIGPVFMVHSGKIIGIQFMIEQTDLLAGESYNFLSALDIKVNHVNTGLLEHGHTGFPEPHYHIDLYTVDKEAEQSIVCENAASDEDEMMHMNMDTVTPATQESMMEMENMEATPSGR